MQSHSLVRRSQEVSKLPKVKSFLAGVERGSIKSMKSYTSALVHFQDFLDKRYYPSRNTIEQNTDELIKAFGAYVVYCFVQAASPVSDSTGVDKYGDKSQTSDRHSFWIRNVLSPFDMYNYFFAVIANNQQRGQNRIQSKRSLYELETDTVEKILDAIKKKYPEYYESLAETSSNYIRRPKQSALEHTGRKGRSRK